MNEIQDRCLTCGGSGIYEEWFEEYDFDGNLTMEPSHSICPECHGIDIDDEEAHLEERQRQVDEFNQKRWREKCLHKSTVALNEEGNAGIYCVGCGKKISNEC